jgi:hypothetical protein
MEHLTPVGDFSPSVESGATIDHYNVRKSCFLVMNLIIEFDILSKSSLGTKIGQLCAEIPLLSQHKTGKIATSRKSRKKLLFPYF